MTRTGITFKAFQFKNGKYLKGLKLPSHFSPNNKLKPESFQVEVTDNPQMAVELPEGEVRFLDYLEFLNGEIVEFEFVIVDPKEDGHDQ